MSITVKEINSKADFKKFIDFPHELYSSDAHYVPELYIAQKEMMDKKKYPFFEYGEVAYFLAYKDNKIVGRIAAINNKRYNDFHKSNIGFFGFMDFVNDLEVVKKLLENAETWLKSKGLEDMLGPTNYSTNETAGTLVDGFDSSPMLMMTYNFSYYPKLLELANCQKEMDLYAYRIPSDEVSEKSIRIAGMLEERLKKKNITIRNINLKKLKSEAQLIKKIYNNAWEDNWGFVPFTDKEFDHLQQSLGMIADKDYLYIAEHNSTPIGFSITLPNINEITKTIKKGRLLPTGIFKLLFNKSKIKNVRILALGVEKDYRKLGIEAIFFAKNIQTARKKGHLSGEASWVLENNTMMMKAAENLNGEKYKTYRIYRKKF